MAITKLPAYKINWWKEGKATVNQLVDASNGNDSNASINAMLGALPTVNPGPGAGFYLNAGVVTKGS